LIKSVEVVNETVRVQFSNVVDTVRLIGNDGKRLAEEYLKDAIQYQFAPSDTYMRIECVIKDGTRFYMNPFFRY
jgi:hypothetical protein